jgi:protein gp37
MTTHCPTCRDLLPPSNVYEGKPGLSPRFSGAVKLKPERLADVATFPPGARVFVTSMSDLFYGDEADELAAIRSGRAFKPVPDEYIDRVVDAIASRPDVVFITLSKRSTRQRDYFQRRPPPPNLWVGVSVENESTEHRLVDLALTPAAVRVVSVEPLLERVSLSFANASPIAKGLRYDALRGRVVYGDDLDTEQALNTLEHGPLGWVIVGGESGRNARPCDVANVLAVVRDCRAAGVPVFVKQLGAEPFDSRPGEHAGPITLDDAKGGDLDEWPAHLDELRVREFPSAALSAG